MKLIIGIALLLSFQVYGKSTDADKDYLSFKKILDGTQKVSDLEAYKLAQDLSNDCYNYVIGYEAALSDKRDRTLFNSQRYRDASYKGRELSDKMNRHAKYKEYDKAYRYAKQRFELYCEYKRDLSNGLLRKKLQEEAPKTAKPSKKESEKKPDKKPEDKPKNKFLNFDK
ncbi:MAG: hypothetical protein ACR2M7_05640 [Bdellovibrionales bacterium]